MLAEPKIRSNQKCFQFLALSLNLTATRIKSLHELKINFLPINRFIARNKGFLLGALRPICRLGLLVCGQHTVTSTAYLLGMGWAY